MTKSEALEWRRELNERMDARIDRAVRDVARARGWVGCHGEMWGEAEMWFVREHPEEYKQICEKYYRPILVCDPRNFNYAERTDYSDDLKRNYERAKGAEVKFYLNVCERFFAALDAGQVRQMEEVAA